MYLFSNIPLIISTNKTNHKYSDAEIKQIIFGSLLGDGKLELADRSINARFGFIQSVLKKEYFLQFYSIFEVFCSSKYRTYTYSDPLQNFEENKKKIILI